MSSASNERRPVSADQIRAAVRLADRMPQWRLVDSGLSALAERLPGREPESVLVKVAALNALYATGVLAIVRMAEHMTKVLAGSDLDLAGPELVEHLALLPMDDGSDRTRRNTSLAAKYAHFFVDPERFPIYDQYVRAMLRYHEGADRGFLAEQSYASFNAHFRAFQAVAGWDEDPRALDRYLWLCGLYRQYRDRQWSRAAGMNVNREAQGLFACEDAGVQSDLSTLLGAASQ